MSAASDDLAPLLVPGGDPALLFSQGTVISWDPATLSSRIRWRDGVILEDIPVLSGVSALGYQSGDEVALLGWDAGGKRGASQWWVLGRLAIPGQDSPDVVIRGSHLVLDDTAQIIVLDDDDNVSMRINRTSGGGGVLATYHPNGETHMLAGDITVGGGNVGQGFLLQRDNGDDLFSVFASAETGLQEVRIWDHGGNQVFTTDKDGFGLDRPYQDIPMYCTNSLGEARTAATDWSSRWIGRYRHTHPAIHAQVAAWVTPDQTTTTGEIRLMINGQQVGSTQVISTTSATIIDFGGDGVYPTTGLGMVSYEFQQITIDAQVTGGDGWISVVPYGVTKRGSA